MDQIFEYFIMHVDYPLLSIVARTIAFLVMVLMLGIMNGIGQKLIKHLFS